MDAASRSMHPASVGGERAHPLGWGLLLALGVLDLVRGGIHLLAPDGGAGAIAGLDLRQGGDAIVTLFALIGASQIAWGALGIAVAWRYRALVPLVLAVRLGQHALATGVMWLYKPLPVEAPGKLGLVATLPLLALALWASLRPARARADATAPAPRREP